MGVEEFVGAWIGAALDAIPVPWRLVAIEATAAHAGWTLEVVRINPGLLDDR